MAQINQLALLSILQGSDQLVIYSSENGDARRISASTAKDYFNPTGDSSIVQYSAPSSTGFSVTIGETTSWLILTPTATFANGTIVLPSAPTDNQEIMVNNTNAITALAFNGSGNTVTGAPNTLLANSFFKLKFNLALSTWYRVG